MHWWGEGVTVIPTVLLPLGGLEGRLGVRLLYDLDAWILTSKMTASQTLAETRSTLRERIKADNPSGTAESTGGSVSLFREKKFRYVSLSFASKRNLGTPYLRASRTPPLRYHSHEPGQ